MTLRTRIALLAGLIAIGASLVAMGTLLVWDLEARRDLLKAHLEANIGSATVWPSILHFQDQKRAEGELLSLQRRVPGIASATAYTTDGRPLASLPGAPVILSRPDRSQQLPQDTVTGMIDTPSVYPQSGNRLLGALLSRNGTLLVSVPILSVVSPLETALSQAEYQLQLSTVGDGARHVVGYVVCIAPPGYFIDAMEPTILRMAGLVALVALLVYLSVNWLSAGISRPLSRLAKVASEINTGDLPSAIRVSSASPQEVVEIANVLNNVIAGTQQIKTRAAADRSLMSLKVDATSKKLNLAEETVTETRNRLKKVAYYDPVTGLANRRLMIENLDILLRIAARERRHVCVVLIDLDNFRRINDTLGREAGDFLLRQITARLKSSVRQSDVVSRDNSGKDISRIGNNEFGVILHGVTKPEDASLVSRRLLDVLGEPFELDGKPLTVNYHLGVAIAPAHGKTPEKLLRAADIALSASARHGGSVPVIYDPELDRGRNRAL